MFRFLVYLRLEGNALPNNITQEGTSEGTGQAIYWFLERPPTECNLENLYIQLEAARTA
jgi:hypothetical protein